MRQADLDEQSGPKLVHFEAGPAASSGNALELESVCVPSGPELCFDATDDNCNGIIDEGCGVHTGAVQFVVAWGASRADVDLNVIDPNGELIEEGRTGQSGLTKQKDCPGDGDGCHGQNFENVYLEEGEPMSGSYAVTVRLERLNGDRPPVELNFGARIGPRTYRARFELERPEDERVLRFEL